MSIYCSSILHFTQTPKLFHAGTTRKEKQLDFRKGESAGNREGQPIHSAVLVRLLLFKLKKINQSAVIKDERQVSELQGLSGLGLEL